MSTGILDKMVGIFKGGTASGVATGWHGWTMSRGPGAKGAQRKEKEEKKRENETFQIPGRGPTQ